MSSMFSITLPEAKAMRVWPESLEELGRLVALESHLGGQGARAAWKWARRVAAAIRHEAGLDEADSGEPVAAFIGTRGLGRDGARQHLFFNLAAAWHGLGGRVVSGGAIGADQAAQWGAYANFLQGASGRTLRLTIEVPWADYEENARPPGAHVNVDGDGEGPRAQETQEIVEHALELQGRHLSPTDTRWKLFRRNAAIVLHSQVVIAWSMRPDGSRSGGTAFGIAIAEFLGTPVIELPRDLERFISTEAQQ